MLTSYITMQFRVLREPYNAVSVFGFANEIKCELGIDLRV